MHGTIVFWCRCTEEFPPSLTRADMVALCRATGGGNQGLKGGAHAGPRGIIFTADTHALSLLCCPRRGQVGIDFHARHIISDLESKQVADPDLSLECVHGKLFNDRDAEFRRYYRMLSGLPADHEVERQEEPAGLARYRGSVIPANIRTWIERQKQIVREIDVEGRHEAELPQQGSFVVAARIDAAADLGREVAALAQFREHHADNL